ncbi:hypothetical protein Trydic_g20250 [Trypoxylus dichotomus]
MPCENSPGELSVLKRARIMQHRTTTALLLPTDQHRNRHIHTRTNQYKSERNVYTDNNVLQRGKIALAHTMAIQQQSNKHQAFRGNSKPGGLSVIHGMCRHPVGALLFYFSFQATVALKPSPSRDLDSLEAFPVHGFSQTVCGYLEPVTWGRINSAQYEAHYVIKSSIHQASMDTVEPHRSAASSRIH